MATDTPKSYDAERELRIRNMPENLLTEINNIGDHIGVKGHTWLKPELLKIIASYPPHYRKKMDK